MSVIPFPLRRFVLLPVSVLALLVLVGLAVVLVGAQPLLVLAPAPTCCIAEFQTTASFIPSPHPGRGGSFPAP